MNLKRLLYPLDGIEARLSEHIAAHKLALWCWALLVMVTIAVLAWVFV